VPRPRSEHKDEQLLEAATALFAARGYASVSVPEIAREAGVGLGTLYRRYESKEALANEVFRRAKRRWREATLARWPHDEAPRAQFEAYWANLDRFARERPDESLFLERDPLGFPLDEASLSLRGETRKESARCVRRWSDAGVKAPLEVVAAVIHGTFWKLAHAGHGPRKRARLLREAREAVWRALT